MSTTEERRSTVLDLDESEGDDEVDILELTDE